MNNGLVSIIVPVYNVERFLNDCFLSIQNQTYKKIEVIFVNDGSTDNSPILLEKFCKSNSYANVINQNNQGAACARNIGLKHASGEYVCFFDPDDIMLPNAISDLVAAIKKTDCDFASSEFLTIDELYKYKFIESNNVLADYKIINKEDFIATYLLSWRSTTSWSMWNKLFKNSIIKMMPNWPEVMLPEMSLGEDLYFFSQYLKLAKKAVHISKQLYFYRTRRSSAVHQPYSKKRFNVFMALDHLIENKELSQKDMAIIKALQAWHAVEALWAMKRGKYKNIDDIKFVYKNIYKKYLKYFWKVKKGPKKYKILPFSVPVMWIVYSIAISRAKNSK